MSTAITAAVIATAGTVYASDKASSSAKKARGFKQRALDEDTRQYEQTREDWQPWRELGGNAIANLEDPDAYKKSPGYNFRLDEGNRAAENLFSMKGGGGNAMRALTEYNQNFASDDYYDYRNDQRLNAGLGTQGTASGASLGQFNANTRSNIWQTSGQDEASIGMWGTTNRNNAIRGGISNLLYGAETAYDKYKNRSTSSIDYDWPEVKPNEINWDDFKG